ncbi:MAG TPA: hypothetical protein VK699_08410 [Terriglobales bacterium]|jgi:hypothetical protein|nr:hypothetical protein [Terriglobales bacterium]
MLRTLVLSMLLLPSLPTRADVGAQPATGTVGADCVIGWEFVLRLADMSNGARAYLIHYGTDYQPDTWSPPLHQKVEFVGKVYATPNQQEDKPWPTTEVTFDSFGAKEATGTYSVTLNDGTHLEGSFHVKRRRLSKHAICA